MAGTGSTPKDGYSMGYSQEMHRFMATRDAAEMADHLLPHLRPGMRLLDCGCGPGSITLGLAAAVAPGEVVGLDIAPVQIERAAALAAEQGAKNVRFETGDVYALPFPDASFAAVNANALLQHLSDPVRALQEFRRVLRPGGIAAIRDPDWGTCIIEPATPLLDLARDLRLRLYAYNGGDASYARHLRRLLLEAGFAYAECYVSVTSRGTPDPVREYARFHVEEMRIFGPTMVAAGLADAATVEAVVEELRAWGERPDATAAIVTFRAIGWVDPPDREEKGGRLIG